MSDLEKLQIILFYNSIPRDKETITLNNLNMPDIITVLQSTIKRERVCFNVLTGTSFLLSPAAARRHWYSQAQSGPSPSSTPAWPQHAQLQPRKVYIYLMIFSEVHHTFYFTYCFSSILFCTFTLFTRIVTALRRVINLKPSVSRQHHALSWGHLQVVLSRLSLAQGQLISHCLEDNIYLFCLRTFVRLHI